MSTPENELFRADAYARRCNAVITAIEELDDGTAVSLDQTVFYPMGGGQPGDQGTLVLNDGTRLVVRETKKGSAPGQILHLVDGADDLEVGAKVVAEIDWDRRYRLMRMHSCLHLLCRAVDGAVTGGSVGDGKGRLDFDIPEPNLDKAEIAATINGWIDADLPISARWISADELAASPELVRTMSVRPPTSGGMVRLVEIEGIDLQACGGTHVATTGEIGPIDIAKIEKKGRQNRRVTVVFRN